MRFLKDLLRSPTVAAVLLVAGLCVVFNSGSSNGTVYKWSTTASTNATADASINWAEGMAPSAVNDSARAMMAAVAKWRDDFAGAITTGGSSTAFTATSNQAFNSLTTMSGQRLCFVPHTTSGASPTLNVDSLGAKSLRAATGSNGNLAAGVLVQGTPYCATYNNANSEWVLVGKSDVQWSVPIGAILDYGGSTAPNSNFVLAFGQCISRTTYAALFALFSTTYNNGCSGSEFGVPDLRGRVTAGKDDMGGGAANRITNGGSGISATNLGAAGGAQTVILVQGNMPSYTLPNTLDVAATGTVLRASTSAGVVSGSNFNALVDGGNLSSSDLQITGSVTSGGSGDPVNKMPPTIILNKILRVL